MTSSFIGIIIVLQTVPWAKVQKKANCYYNNSDSNGEKRPIPVASIFASKLQALSASYFQIFQYGQ